MYILGLGVVDHVGLFILSIVDQNVVQRLVLRSFDVYQPPRSCCSADSH